MISLQQYISDPELATEQIRDQIRENLAAQGVPVNSHAKLADMLTRFEIINLELARLHHRLLDIEVQS